MVQAHAATQDGWSDIRADGTEPCLSEDRAGLPRYIRLHLPAKVSDRYSIVHIHVHVHVHVHHVDTCILGLCIGYMPKKNRS